ncbi:MAG: bifunctional glutamate N-acetyltransferase/amino-acid acetyltransferase ArgJ [Nitrospinae bacterium]|nr:bifunctional glutamate N-acetyltransferase/amino-acid acetyltransferase ArgJ [Nitrospinota bacterium]
MKKKAAAAGSGVTAPKGFAAGGIHCGVKKTAAKDLAVIISLKPAVASGVFTRNSVKGAPVIWSREVARRGGAMGIVANSGNSNVLTKEGYVHAGRMAAAVAKHIGCGPEKIFVASTGVIGQPLPIEKVEKGVAALMPNLSRIGGGDAAEAIMTTDLVKKEFSAHTAVGGKTVTIGGCAKGSGMISPSMATMLAFITTDAAMSKAAVRDLTKRACDASFNRVTVDGDTSTSDMLLVMANGASGAPLIAKPSGAAYSKVLEKVTQACVHLAQEVVRDGEGATKFISVAVKGAASQKAAERVAMAIAKSPLVKTAFFGQDANWGRILCAAGYSGVPIDPSRVTLSIGGVTIFRKGGLVSGDWEKKASARLKLRDIAMVIDLGAGAASTEVWTCDFSYDYIRINADYRT